MRGVGIITKREKDGMMQTAWLYRGILVVWCWIAVSAVVLAASTPIVEDGRPRAVVITAAEPTPIAAYAAKELVEHIEKSTGARLTVRPEGDGSVPAGYTPIYVGNTAAARAAGLDAGALGIDAFIYRVQDGRVYLLGKEDDSTDPLENRLWGATRSPHNGTLFGVYEFIERHLGVRWLWPGELGTFVPAMDAVAVEDTDEVVAPALKYRRARYPWLAGSLRDYAPELKRMAFTEEGLQRYAAAVHAFQRRQRMGYAKRHLGHTFHRWWNRFGKQHPDWFRMNPDGSRAVPDDDSRFQRHGVPMCVSNPELHRQIVDLWDGTSLLRLGEVDVAAYCHCPECLSWDGPQPEDRAQRVISDRYARFWKAIFELAAERNPNVEIGTLLYMHYFPAPSDDVTLVDNILGKFCPWGGGNTIWYPAAEDELEWQRQQWAGWARTGIRMIYRPNDMLAGYVMPHIHTRQRADFFHHAYDSGRMVGVDLDSVLGQWAVRGPEHYMAFRLLNRPDLSLEEVLAEYYTAFGPAEAAVREYFAYWEDYNEALQAAGRWQDLRRRSLMRRSAPRLYPADVFEDAHAILERAMAAARTAERDVYAERVAFLRKGLEHAQLSIDLIRALTENRADGSDALQKVVEFRKRHEAWFISDFVQAARMERRAHGEKLDEWFAALR